MAIAEEALFSNDLRCIFRKHTTNVENELRRHKIRKYSDLIASQYRTINCLVHKIGPLFEVVPLLV